MGQILRPRMPARSQEGLKSTSLVYTFPSSGTGIGGCPRDEPEDWSEMSVSASSDSAAEATVLVLDDTHGFEAPDGTRLWQIGFVPIDEDGDFLPEEDYRTSDPRC